MVKTWAEKETRNLLRVGEKGIRCPKPVHLKLHVLAMEFIGKNGCNAPRLKDAGLSDDKLRVAYFEIVTTMRTLYQKCKLVHGDLSEYNILYYEGHLYIIDVSQSVDLDHPLALDFLKEDCLHVNDFFEKRGVAVMTVTELFNLLLIKKLLMKMLMITWRRSSRRFWKKEIQMQRMMKLLRQSWCRRWTM